MEVREGSSSSGIGSMQGACRCHRHHQPSPAPLVIEDIEIPVWVGNSEKWLTGLTKRTTCDDVIYALLCQESNSTSANHSVSNHAIFEQWRGVRRPLKGRTKIIKVWRAWGSDSRNVKLFLCELENNFDTSSEVSRNWHHRRRGSRDVKPGKSEKLRDSRKNGEGANRDSRNKNEGAIRDGRNKNEGANRDSRKYDAGVIRDSRKNDEGANRDSGKANGYAIRDSRKNNEGGIRDSRKNDEGGIRNNCRSGEGANRDIRNNNDGFNRDNRINTDGHITEQKQGNKTAALTDKDPQRYSKSTGRTSQTNGQTERSRKSKHSYDRTDSPLDSTRYSTITPSNAFLKSINEEEIPLAAMRLKEHAEYQELLHVVTEQESVIAQQMHQLNETELQIATYEHKSNQIEPYETDTSDSSLFPNIKANDMEAYLHICDSIIDMQNKIDTELAKINDLSTTINEETQLDASNSVHMDRDHGLRVQEEVEAIRRDLKRSVALSIAQQKQLQLVSETLNACETQLRIKRQHVERLTRELAKMESDDNVDNDAGNYVGYNDDNCGDNDGDNDGENDAKDHKDLSADLCSSSGVESGIEISPVPGTKSGSQPNRFFQNSQPNQNQTHHRLDNYNQLRKTSNKMDLNPESQTSARNLDANQTKASNLKKGILRTKSQGYSVRFADEVNGNSDYVNVDPCLTQVFEYSKYEGHNYMNIDDLDQGCYAEDDYEEVDEVEDTDWMDGQSQAYNVDTGELYYGDSTPKASNPTAHMVPYITYQVRTPDLDIPGVKTNSSDDNSDTGLSSMHSDDPIPPVLETLV